MSEPEKLETLPSYVLFVCSFNAVRSPMAAGLMQAFWGHEVYVDSCGVHDDIDTDGFAIGVMDELGIDISAHRPKQFDQLEDTSYDLVIALSAEACNKARELARTTAAEVVCWDVADASGAGGNREMRMEAYRQVRDDIYKKLLATFPKPSAKGVSSAWNYLAPS